MAIEATLPYTIDFENSPNFAATAAQRVTITQQIDTHVNPLSFQG